MTDIIVAALARLSSLPSSGFHIPAAYTSEKGQRIGADRAIKLTYDTFLISEGRQYAQPAWIDVCIRRWREQGLELEWKEIESENALRAVMSRPLPAQHTHVPAELVPKVYGQWYEWFKSIARYNYARDARYLPDRSYVDEVITAIGGRYDESSFTEEERCGMTEAFNAIGNRDPTASMSVDEATAEFVLAAAFKSDGHWMLSELRPRPGKFLPDRHGSMLRHVIQTSLSRKLAGRRLSDVQAACVRVSAVIGALWEKQPEHPALELYRSLLEGHNVRHPNTPVTSLHH